MFNDNPKGNFTEFRLPIRMSRVMGWGGGRGMWVGLHIREAIFALLKKSLLDLEGRENIVLVCEGVFR